MNFGTALQYLRGGCRLTRPGWNGIGMFIYLVPGSKFEVNRAPLLGVMPFGTEVQYLPHIDFRRSDGTYAVWTPSISDVLANDWALFEATVGERDITASTFSAALTALDAGKSIRRASWNGKGLSLKLVRAGDWIVVHTRDYAPAYAVGNLSAARTFLPFIVLCLPDGGLVPYAFPQTDLLVDDWEVID